MQIALHLYSNGQPITIDTDTILYAYPLLRGYCSQIFFKDRGYVVVEESIHQITMLMRGWEVE